MLLLPPGAGTAETHPVPTSRLPEVPAAEKIGPRLAELAAKYKPEREVMVLADLSVQVDLGALGAEMTDAGLGRAERAARVRDGLREVAEREQASLEPTLADWKHRGWVRSWRGVRIVNRLILETRVDALPRLAGSPAIARLWDGERPRPLAGGPRPVGLSAGRAWPKDLRRANWALDALGIPALWTQRRTGRGVVVGILDSGVEGAHPQLAPNRRRTESWFDPVEGRSEPWDSAGHGTSVLSAAVAANRSGYRIGVAPAASWVAALANPRGLFHLRHFTEAADWMLFSGRPDVLLMAFGFEPGTCQEDLRAFVDAFRAAEVFTVFAAGNEGPAAGSDISPANYTGLYPGDAAAFSVGGLERDLRAYPRGGAGPNSCGEAVYPTVTAPAGRLPVAGASPRTPYDWQEGTSFAAACAAGVAALAYQLRPDLLVPELEAAFTGTARDLGPEGPDDRYGYGLLAPALALRRLEAARAGARPR